ncbi:MAG: DUF554 domain-containing protein [Propionibacteriaceae bacterium]|nr:DUF554 domain-containing protein [Propionibacteriaceae bacterium]
MFVGVGTVVNVFTVLLGSSLGLLIGNRISDGTRDLIMQIVGLFTLVLAGDAIIDGLGSGFNSEVPSIAPMLIVLGSLLIGGLFGAAVRLERRMDGLADAFRRKFASKSDKGRFVEAAVTTTLIFCVGPLALLGSLSDGLGLGADQLFIKAILDGFTSIAFASSLGVGVLASVIPMALYQGILTALGFFLGDFLSPGQVDSLTATGGVVLLGLGLRLLDVKRIRVGDMLPALFVAPCLTWAAAFIPH